MEEEVEATASEQRRCQCARGRRIGLGVGVYVATPRIAQPPSVHRERERECPKKGDETHRCVRRRFARRRRLRRRRRRRHKGVRSVCARLRYPRCYCEVCMRQRNGTSRYRILPERFTKASRERAIFHGDYRLMPGRIPSARDLPADDFGVSIIFLTSTFRLRSSAIKRSTKISGRTQSR